LPIIMTDTMSYVILAGIGIAVFLAGVFFRKIMLETKVKDAMNNSRRILEEAGKEVASKRRESELEAKDLLYRTRTDFEKETKDRRQELLGLEKRLIQKEENLDRKVDLIEVKEKELDSKAKSVKDLEAGIHSKSKELDRLLNEEKLQLQKIAHLSTDQAKRLLLTKMESEVRQDASLMIKRIEAQTKETASKKAKEIISLAIQRCAAEHTVESTVSVVTLPSDEMKGRIIGREGRNIRALETATGIDVIVDDTPEAVILSGFDPIRREIAKRSLEKLIMDGRIHPGRIEEVVEGIRKEMEVSIREGGEKTVMEVDIHNLHPKLIELLGRLEYRTSYGQNVLQHSKEVAYVAGVLASELGLDFRQARRAGLLHDIGKSIDHEVEGTHVQIGKDLAKKYGENEKTIHAIEAHHEDIEAQSVLAVLIQAADAISASRPGARRETLESYVKRLEKLESIADSFKGVDKTYAIQAGREVRVIVQPNKVDDNAAVALAREISKKIEEGMEYPGQVKVTVIRETRAVEYAK